MKYIYSLLVTMLMLYTSASACYILVEPSDTWMWTANTDGWDSLQMAERSRQNVYGSIIEVRSNDVVRQAKEGWPTFMIVSIPSLPKADLIHFMEQYVDTLSGETIYERDWGIDSVEMSNWIQNMIDNDSVLIENYNPYRKYFKKRREQ